MRHLGRNESDSGPIGIEIQRELSQSAQYGDTGGVSVKRLADGTAQVFDPVDRYGGFGAIVVLAVIAATIVPQTAGAIGEYGMVSLLVAIELGFGALVLRVRRVGVLVSSSSVEVVGLCWPIRSVRILRSEVIGLTSDNVAAIWMVALEMRDGSSVRCPMVMPEPIQKIGLFGEMRTGVRAELARELGLSAS